MQLHVFFVTFVTFVAVSLPYNAMKKTSSFRLSAYGFRL